MLDSLGSRYHTRGGCGLATEPSAGISFGARHFSRAISVLENLRAIQRPPLVTGSGVLALGACALGLGGTSR